MTLGSRSMYRERGTCFPEEVSEKKVLKPPSLADGEPSSIRPSGFKANQRNEIYINWAVVTHAKTVLNGVKLPYR